MRTVTVELPPDIYEALVDELTGIGVDEAHAEDAVDRVAAGLAEAIADGRVVVHRSGEDVEIVAGGGSNGRKPRL